MRKLRSFLLALSVLFLAGCHAKFAILDPKGIIALEEKKLFIEAVLLMLIVVIPVIILSILVPWRYRASNKKATYRPDWAHSTLLEFIWWTIPCVIIGILSVMVWKYTHSLDPYRPLDSKKQPVMIEAIAMNWKWLFIYPEHHVAVVNELVIPVDQPVRFFITSDGPMNSLEIPNLAGQIYAMTGMQTKLNLMATDIGEYRGLSTNFSGLGFSGMHFKVRVASDTDYKNWIAMLQKIPQQLTQETYDQLTKDSENNPIAYYSHVKDGLFSDVIIKYMGPMPGMTLGYQPDPKFGQ